MIGLRGWRCRGLRLFGFVAEISGADGAVRVAADVTAIGVAGGLRWERDRCGGGLYLLSHGRIDSRIRGSGGIPTPSMAEVFKALRAALRARCSAARRWVRFIVFLLKYGNKNGPRKGEETPWRTCLKLA